MVVFEGIAISGWVVCYVKEKPKLSLDDYWPRLIESVKEVVTFKKYEGGFYFFEGGTLSLFQVPKVEEENVAISFRFADVSDPSFLDNVFEVATNEVNFCRFSCSVRGEVDFTKLKNWVKTFGSKWLGETEEAFSSVLVVGGHVLRLTAYPKTKILSISGTFERRVRSPSNVLKDIFQQEPMAIMSVRVPICFKESYLGIAKSLKSDLSRIQRNALKRYLETFYREEIKKLVKP